MNDLTQQLRDLLRRIQWCGVEYRWQSPMPACPVCRAPKGCEQGHHPDCELARLAEIERPPMPRDQRDAQVAALKAQITRLEALPVGPPKGAR